MKEYNLGGIVFPFQRACFCFTLKNGALSVAATQVLNGALRILSNLLSFNLISMLFDLFLLMLGFLLGYGVYKGVEKMVQAWLALEALFCFLVYPIYFFISLSFFFPGEIIYTVFWICFYTYCWLVVMSYYMRGDVPLPDSNSAETGTAEPVGK